MENQEQNQQASAEQIMLQTIIEKLNQLETQSGENTFKPSPDFIEAFRNAYLTAHKELKDEFYKQIKSIDKNSTERIDSIAKSIQADSWLIYDATQQAYFKHRSFIMSIILAAFLILSGILNIVQLTHTNSLKANSLKFKSLRYSTDETLRKAALSIDKYFNNTNINTIEERLSKLEKEERRILRNLRMAHNKEQKAFQLIEEAKQLKTQ